MREKSVSFEDAVLRVPSLAEMKLTNDKEDVVNEKKEPEIKGNKQDYYVALILFVLSFISVKYTNLNEIGLINSVIMMGFIGTSVAYVLWHGYSISRVNLMILLCMILACIPNAIYTNNTLKLWNMIFMNVLLMYWILSCCGHLSEKKDSNWILFDFLVSVVHVPFGYLKKTIAFLLNLSIRNINFKNLVKVIVGIMMSIPLLIIILPLLFSADSEFQSMFFNVVYNFDTIITNIFIMLLSLPLFLYYFSSCFANTCCEVTTKSKKTKMEDRLKRLACVSPIIVTTLEVVLCCIYVLFIMVTCNSIYVALTAYNLDFSYAHYARSGFFELCYIAVINFAVIMFIEVINQQKNTFANRLAKSMLCIETICIIITALFRLGMYMNAYGLTELRVYSAWLMLVMFGIFFIVLFHTFKKGNDILHIVRYACICFLILNLMNVDGFIRSVNDNIHLQSNRESLVIQKQI